MSDSDLPQEALDDQPEGEPEQVEDSEADGGQEPAPQTWDGEEEEAADGDG